MLFDVVSDMREEHDVAAQYRLRHIILPTGILS
jgi:hypothetical protein